MNRTIIAGMVVLCGWDVWASGGPPLSGPAVQEYKAKGPKTDFDGRVRRTESRPEEDLVRAMDLSPDERTRVDEVLRKRAATLDRFVAEHWRELLATVSAGQAHDVPGIIAGVWSGLAKLKQSGFQADLAAQLRRAMSSAHAAEFDRKRREYWRAVRLEKGANVVERGLGVFGEHVELFGKEIEAAYKRIEASGELAMHYLTDDLNLSVPQREKVRDIFFRLHEKSKGAPSKKDEEKAFGELLGVLDAEQRAKLLKKVK